ncbi:YybH family protein [Shewanella sp. GXUN23E]|uniref:YybH family protein n=1 Tax=Shewanella sp. GXUN23E TaxID=3422498 RepID=UPI003D7F0A0F
MWNKAVACFLMVISSSVLAVPSDDITKLLSQQQQAWNRGDIEGYMAGYWHDDRMRFVSNDTVRYGWQTTLDAYRRHYPDRATMGQLTFDIDEIKMLSNYAALVVGHWQLQRQKDNPKGMFSLLVERIDDQWVITHDHSSD